MILKKYYEKKQTHTQMYIQQKQKQTVEKTSQQKTNEISLHFLPEYAPMTPKNPPKK